MDWPTILVASIPGLFALLGILVNARKDRRQVEATATDLIAGAATKAVTIIEKELERTIGNLTECKQTLIDQEVRIGVLETADADKQTRIEALRRQVIALGSVPLNGSPH